MRTCTGTAWATLAVPKIVVVASVQADLGLLWHYCAASKQCTDTRWLGYDLFHVQELKEVLQIVNFQGRHDPLTKTTGRRQQTT